MHNTTHPTLKVIAIDDYRTEAWRVSRPKSVSYDLEDFEAISFGLQDLCRITVEVTGPATLRELMFNTPGYAAWAQSSRNIGTPNIPLMPERCCDEADYAASVDLWNEALDLSESAHQDIGRMRLPQGHMSSWTFNAPLRTYVGLWKSCDALGLDDYRDWYFTPVLLSYLGDRMPDEVTDPMESCIIPEYTRPDIGISAGESWVEGTFGPVRRDHHLWADEINRVWREWLREQLYEGVFAKYGPVHPQVTLDPSTYEDGLTVNHGDMVIINRTIPMALRAQLVRQSQASVQDDYWHQIKERGRSMEALPLSAPVKCTVTMTRKAYEDICAKRACFIAQSSLWAGFLLPLIREQGFAATTPCGGCKANCALKIEAEDCAAGNATTLACPIYEEDTQFFHARRKVEAGLNDETAELYNDHMASFFEQQPYYEPSDD